MMSDTPSTLHISGFGKKLKKHNDLLMVEWNVDGGKKSLIFTPQKLEHVLLSGDHSITTGAMKLLFDNDVSLTCLDNFGNPLGYLFSDRRGQIIDVWEKQIQLETGKAICVARSICQASANNKVTVLSALKRSRNIVLSEEIYDIRSNIDQMDDAFESDTLMGYEGMSSRVYFKALKMVIPDVYGFSGRLKHPSPDIVNVMLSYGYGILYSKIRSALVGVNLNPYRGVLHASYRNQEALVYDLIEEFRQPIVDRSVLTLVGRKQVDVGDFDVKNDHCIMDDRFKREYADFILSRLESETKYEGRTETFQNIIEFQARKLKDAIVNDVDYAPFVYMSR